VTEHPAEALTLPPELAGGPSVDVWAPAATLLPPLDDDTPAEHRRITAWRPWHTAGEQWNTVHHLPAEHWQNLLSPALRYVVTAEGGVVADSRCGQRAGTRSGMGSLSPA